jgi:type IV secretion system protein VirB9
MLVALLLSASVLAGCARNPVPEFSYDESVPPLPTPPASAAEERPRPLHTPPVWTVAHGGAAAGTPTGRIENANAAARIEPRREGYYNAIQIYPWSEGALYQVYAAPGQITNIALEPGERLTGAGPIAAGDTTRWIIGDTESGSGSTARVHILVKPTRDDISTNLVISTDRRVYTIELRAREALYMPSVAWAYPAAPRGGRQAVATAPTIRRRRPVIIVTACRSGVRVRPGARFPSSMMAAASMSSSRPASPRAKCRRSSCSAPMESRRSSTAVSTATC